MAPDGLTDETQSSIKLNCLWHFIRCAAKTEHGDQKSARFNKMVGLTSTELVLGGKKIR